MRLLAFTALSIGALAIAALVTGTPALSAEPGESRAAPTPPPGLTQDDIVRQHPSWFSENIPYRPCPCSVIFPGGRHACLGTP